MVWIFFDGNFPQWLAKFSTEILNRPAGRKSVGRRRWEYGHGEFKLRRLLERRRFTRIHSDDSEDEPAPMLPPITA
ncbi:jg13581 [Pararge aegeria aegeria]|uniref:Jg13581 protein n=1 Tax=Pararge aegeria aegeria TaxID=348720 RepID=A0A8S4QST8_9NEOP|nr:jg13581 [Pararge aegeria aegeria]